MPKSVYCVILELTSMVSALAVRVENDFVYWLCLDAAA